MYELKSLQEDDQIPQEQRIQINGIAKTIK